MSEFNVVPSSAVMIANDAIVYAGPIKGAPAVAGRLVLLNPTDYARLKTTADQMRN